MSQTPAMGRNRTGIASAPDRAREMVTGMVDELARIVPSTTTERSHECKDGIYALTGRG